MQAAIFVQHECQHSFISSQGIIFLHISYPLQFCDTRQKNYHREVSFDDRGNGKIHGGKSLTCAQNTD